MIREIIPGNITSPRNPCDIIIGMNSDLQDVTGIGRRFVMNRVPTAVLQLGSVITFNFDTTRLIRMIICHKLGQDGWENADMHIRYAMDHLHHMNGKQRQHSIVQIGNGRIGRRDGADKQKILMAMAMSYLEVDLYINDKPVAEIAETSRVRVLHPHSAWSPSMGRVRLAA